MWLPPGTAQPMMAHHMTSQLTAISQSNGIALFVATNGWHKSAVALQSKPVALNVPGVRIQCGIQCVIPGCNHPLLKDWDSEANAKEGLFPDKLTLGSSKRVHWVCHKCPLGLTHKYVSALSSRTLAGNGCSCCSERTACKCNSLLSLYPEVAQEWDHCKNDGCPGDYTAASSAVVWWLSTDKQSWQQTIKSRTDNRLKRHKNRAT